jgi:hypothetical protein
MGCESDLIQRRKSIFLKTILSKQPLDQILIKLPLVLYIFEFFKSTAKNVGQRIESLSLKHLSRILKRFGGEIVERNANVSALHLAACLVQHALFGDSQQKKNLGLHKIPTLRSIFKLDSSLDQLNPYLKSTRF